MQNRTVDSCELDEVEGIGERNFGQSGDICVKRKKRTDSKEQRCVAERTSCRPSEASSDWADLGIAERRRGTTLHCERVDRLLVSSLNSLVSAHELAQSGEICAGSFSFIAYSQ